MDFWDLVPFIVGALYLFSKGKSKEVPPKPQAPRPQPKTKTTEPSFEEVLRELMGDVSRQPQVVTEPPAPKTLAEERSEQRSFETPVKKKKGKTVHIESIESRTWSYDDHIEDEIKEEKRTHHEIDRHFAIEQIGLKAEDIDLRNAVIYDAILRRPEY